MKNEVITVAKDKCPLEVLSAMGERIKNSWIFLHRNVFNKLMHIDGVSCKKGDPQQLILTFNVTEGCQPHEIVVHYERHSYWEKVLRISATDIAFEHSVTNPENIFFLKMEE